MAVRSESRAKIRSSPEAVFAYLTDFGRWREWAPRIAECQVRGGGPLRTGATLDQRVTTRSGGTKPRTLEVIAVEARRVISFAGKMGPSAMTWGFSCTAQTEASTELVLWIEVEVRGPMRLMPAAAMRSGFRRVNGAEVARIKSAVERTSVGTATRVS